MPRKLFIKGKHTRGADNVVKFFMQPVERIFREAEEEGQEAAKEAAEAVLNHTIPLTPEDTGALRASGKVVKSPKNTGYQVVFGGETNVHGKNSPDGIVRYALMVHEDLPSGQARTYTVGGPKYLTKGAESARSEIKSIFEKYKKKILARTKRGK